MGICYIIGAGELGEELPSPKTDDLVIACDGGYAYCSEKGIRTDLIVGDFDSLGFVPKEEYVIRLNPMKDETDTAWAVREGQKRGYREFMIYGGMGGRMSHTIANIQLLTDLALQGQKAILKGKDCWCRVINNEEFYFDADMQGYFSVFCLGDKAEGVYEEGLRYSLENATLTKDDPIGVSNEFVGKESRVAVREGTLLLIWEKINDIKCPGQ